MYAADATAVMVPSSATTVEPTCPFPLQALPGTLQSFCTDLAGQCALPVETVAVICLWTLMRATTPGARLCAAEVEIPIADSGDWLFVVRQDTASLGNLLEIILQPVIRGQAERAAALEILDANRLALREAQLKRELEQMGKAGRFSDPVHVEFVRAELDRIQAQRRPLLMIKDPTERQLKESLPYFLDHAPGLVVSDARGHADVLEGLTKARNGSASVTPKPAWAVCLGLTKGSAAPASSSQGVQIALLCCSDAEFIEEMAVQQRDVLRNSFLVGIPDGIAADNKQITLDAQPWNSLVQQALAPRLARAHRGWRLTWKAAEALNAGVAGLAASPGATSLGSTPAAITGMIGRLALALHASLCPPGTELPHEAMECTLELLRWLLQARERVVQACLAKGQEKRDAKAEATMLQKLQSRGGRVRRRDLVRMYYEQRQAIHGPVLERLLRKDAIFEDEKGFVCLTEQLEKTPLTKCIDERTY